MSTKLLAGNSDPILAQHISDALRIPLSPCSVSKFSDKETSVNIIESLRDHDVFILQTGFNPHRRKMGPFTIHSHNMSRESSPSRVSSLKEKHYCDVNPALLAHQSAIMSIGLNHDPNDLLMELLIMVAACKSASARRITAVIPCFPYTRMDKKIAPRTPITAKMVAKMLEIAGCDRVITIDLHATQIQGFFNIPVDNLTLEMLIVRWIRSNIPSWKDAVIVSPDAGGAKRATAISDTLDMDFALINQTHVKDKEDADVVLVGDVDNKTAIVIDDMCDTGKTVTRALRALSRGNVKSIYVIISHGILSGETTKHLLSEPKLERLVVSDTINQEAHQALAQELGKKLDIIHTGPLLAEAIRRTHNGESISMLFNSDMYNV